MIAAADFLVAHGPSDGVERWEEQSGDSPSTIAAEIAGLTAASHIAAVNGDPARSRLYQAVADQFARTVKALTVTDNGPFISPAVPSYFIRVDKNGDPELVQPVQPRQRHCRRCRPALGDRRRLLGPGAAGRPLTERSHGQVLADRRRRHPPALDAQRRRVLRYGINSTESADGYGDCYQPSGSSCTTPGAPWPPTDTGTGHLWPVLSGERGEYDLAAADPSVGPEPAAVDAEHAVGPRPRARAGLGGSDLAASPYGAPPATASIGFSDGKAAGSASPLTWAQAQFARLAIDLSAGRDVDTPRSSPAGT